MPSSSLPPKPEKAYLAILPPTTDGGGARAAASRSGGGGGVPGALDQFTFQFNPNEYSITKTATWKRNPDAGSAETAIPEFLGSEPRKFTVKYLIDASETGTDLKAQLDLLFSCCTPTDESRSQNKPKPPFVLFGWGKTTSFTACVTSVTAEYKMFSPEGTCIRASGSLTLEEIPTQQRGQNPTSGGLAARRTHTVVAGDSLTSIAYREYGRPDMWRALAEANGVDDPPRLQVGRRLMVPPADDLQPPAGARRRS
jgi:nucleoid-associated protein YgaU